MKPDNFELATTASMAAVTELEAVVGVSGVSNACRHELHCVIQYQLNRLRPRYAISITLPKPPSNRNLEPTMPKKQSNYELAELATRAALKVLDQHVQGKNSGGIDDKCAYDIHNTIEKHLDRIRPANAVDTMAPPNLSKTH
jgi:hypothetical protein